MAGEKGRPSKFETFVIALKDFLEREESATFLTDEELIEQVNYGLHEDDKISLISYKKYKAGDLPKSAESETIDLFFILIKKAKSDQKLILLRELRSKTGHIGWQRFAWLLERKFVDMRMIAKEEDKPKAETDEYIIGDNKIIV